MVVCMRVIGKHQRPRPDLLPLAILFSLLFPAQAAWCAQADSAKVDLILHDLGADSTSAKGGAPAYEHVVDAVATGETQHLGAGENNWNAENPKWKPIYDRIHADLERDLPGSSAYAAIKECEGVNCYARDVASNLDPADVDAILSYLGTTEGKRFQVFQLQVNEILQSGIKAASAQKTQSKHSALPEERTKPLFEMLKLSFLVQSLEARADADAGRDPSGGDGIAWLMVFAEVEKEAELEKLHSQYGNDLATFEAFTKTDAARHLIDAAGKADAKGQQRLKLVYEGIQGIVDKHEEGWKALLKGA